jgi:KDO2-lipid IV(A) lauroyltransferase
VSSARPRPLPIRLLALGARVLPIRLILGLCDLAGSLLYAFSPRRRGIAAENLSIALGPDLRPRERRRLARASFRSLLRVFGELAVAERLYRDPRRAEARLRFAGDWDALDADVAAGRPGLIVTGHLGNWELGALAVRRRGAPLRVMARPTGRGAMDGLLSAWRGGSDLVLPKTGGIREVLRCLQSGAWIALLADQNAGRHGLFVPFFGLEASTFPTPVVLARRLDLPLYLGACLRRPGPPGSFDVHLERVDLGEADPREAGLEAAVLHLNRRLEAWIRRAPEQYNWAHRRWKTRPPGRDCSEPGQPTYARLWPLGPDGAPLHGREPMP